MIRKHEVLEKIIGVLKDAQVGVSVQDLWRKRWIGEGQGKAYPSVHPVLIP
jgi:hypothetical protein